MIMFVRCSGILMCCVCAWIVNANLLVVLVNRIRLHVVPQPSNGNVHERVQYYYGEGDKVDVSCVSLQSALKIKIYSDYYDIYLDEHMLSGGLRSTLLKEHNGSHLSCECYYTDYYTATVNITFVVQNKVDSVFKLVTNGFTWRNQNLSTSQVLNYYCIEDPTKTYPCQASEYFQVKTLYLELTGQRKGHEVTNATYSVIPGSYHSLRYEARYRTTPDVHSTIDILFNQLPQHCVDYEPLTMNTSDGSRTTILYQYNGDQLVVYQYVEGERASFCCSTAPELAKQFGQTGHYVLFENTVSRNMPYVTKTLQLTAADDNTTLQCTLAYYNPLTKQATLAIKRLRLMFRLTSPSAAGAQISLDLQPWIVAIVATTCVIVAFIIIGICSANKRKRSAQETPKTEDNYEDVALPTYDPNWSTPSAPRGNLSNIDAKRRLDQGATKSNERKKENHELHYADVDVSHYGNVLPQRRDAGTPYAEVRVWRPKHSRDDKKMYVNK